MAKKILLRDYQKSILDRLDNIKNTKSNSSVSYLGVVLGDKHVLLSLKEIGETMPALGIQKVPLVKSWFLGVANVRGVLYAVNDLLYLLDEKFANITSSTRLMIINDNVVSNAAFIADKLIGLRSLDLMTKRKEKMKNHLCFKPETYKDTEGRVWYVMDCIKLVNSKEFSMPYLA